MKRKMIVSIAAAAALCGGLSACGSPDAPAGPKLPEQTASVAQGHEKECKAALSPFVESLMQGNDPPETDAEAACKGFSDDELTGFTYDLLKKNAGKETADDFKQYMADHDGSFWSNDQGETESPAAGEPDDFGMYDASKDIKLKSCRLGDPYDLGDSLPMADVSIKNPASAKESMHFEYEVEVLDANGDRVELLTGAAEDVRPGQLIDTRDGDEDANSSSDNDVHGKITCEIITAQKAPASDYH